MRTNSSIFNSNFPSAGLLALVLLIVFECIYLTATEGLSGIPFVQPTVDDGMVQARVTMIERHAPDARMLITGDSSALHNIVPAEFEHVVDGPVLNLGTLLSFGPYGHLELAARALQRGTDIHSVLISELPLTLQMDLSRARDYGLLYRYLVSYPAQLVNISPGTEDWLAWFRKKHRFNRFPEKYGGSYEALLGRLEQTSGFLPLPSGNLTARTHKPMVLSSDSQLALSRFIEFAEERGVRVSLVVAPRPASRITQGYSDSVSTMMEELKQAFPTLQLIQEGVFTHPDSAFADDSHLTAESASKYSKALASQIFYQGWDSDNR